MIVLGIYRLSDALIKKKKERDKNSTPHIAQVE